MKTKNNWCTSNIANRMAHKSTDFIVTLRPYDFDMVNFTQASENVAFEIAQNFPDLYLAFSGGLDSDYLMRLFHRLGIPVTPIIVCYGNELENSFAHNTCKELKVEPIVMNITKEEFLHEFKTNINVLADGIGFNSTQPIFAARYVESKSGTLLMGGHFLGDGDDKINNKLYASLNEWDFYPDLYAPNLNVIDPMMYTPQIVYSMMPTYENEGWNTYKHKLYGIPYRPKYKAKYTHEMMNEIYSFRKFKGKRGYSHYWSKEQFQSLMEPHIANK